MIILRVLLVAVPLLVGGLLWVSSGSHADRPMSSDRLTNYLIERGGGTPVRSMAERAADAPAASTAAAALPPPPASASDTVRDVAPALVPPYAEKPVSPPASVAENEGSARPVRRNPVETDVKPDKLASAPTTSSAPPAPALPPANAALPPPLPQTAAEEDSVARKQVPVRAAAVKSKMRNERARRRYAEDREHRGDGSYGRAWPSFSGSGSRSLERSREARARRMRERYEARGYRTVEQRVLPDGRRMLVFEADD